MKRVLTAAVIVLVAASACGRKDAVQQPDTQPAVALSTARYGAFERHVTATGRVGMPGGSETKVGFAQSGIIAAINVHVGEAVAQGEPLASLESSGFSLAAQQAQADAAAAGAVAQQSAVDRTSAKIAVDEAALRRAQTLYAAGVSARKDIEAAQAQLAADRAEAASAGAGTRAAAAQAESARVKSALAERDLSNATLRAPVGGVVTAILKHPGEAADPASPVISIGPASTKQLTLTLSAADAAQVRIGNPVNFTVAGTSVSGRGRVSAISPVLDPATQTSTVVVSGLPLGTAAGSAIEASIDVAAVRGILVPQTAIVQDPQTSQTLVFVEKRDKDGKPAFAQRSVTVADHDDKTAVIASGLRPGERVAAQGAFALLAPSGGD